MNRMVSVIIPVYNTGEYLAGCVESVRGQTLADLEIILVDDGSTDGSGELCDRYGEKDPRIRVLHQANGGSTSARNAGLRASRGEYVGFVDSDDWMEPGMYEGLLDACVENGADMAVSVKYCNREKSEYREQPGVPEGVYDRESPGRELARNLIYTVDGRRGISPNLYDKLFKRELLCRHQFAVDERIRYGEDDACVYGCLLDAGRVVILDRAWYHYRIREGSVCHTGDDTYFEQVAWLYRQLRETFLRQPEPGILMEQLNRYMMEFILRGINRQFGFGYGVVVPFYLPPFRTLQERGVRRLVLYGAGNVGQDYFRALQLWRCTEVAVWVDRQPEPYREKGLPVEPVSRITETGYDAVLIAVEKKTLAEQIRSDLIRLGIEADKIIYEEPGTVVRGIGGRA